MTPPRAPMDVDRDTERRNAWLQFAGLALFFTVLLVVSVPDETFVLALAGPLIAVQAYRSWAVERFSPTQAQFYARAVVAGAADAMVAQLHARRHLADCWAHEGTAVDRLFALPPVHLATAMRALDRDRYPPRRLRTPWHHANRALAATLGAALGMSLGWASGRASTGCVSAAGLAHALPWHVWLALVAVVAFRLLVRRHNGRQLARVVDAMRTRPAAELTALLDPPWRGRRWATAAELNRLADHAGRSAARVPPSELTAVTILLASGLAVGLLLAGRFWAC